MRNRKLVLVVAAAVLALVCEIAAARRPAPFEPGAAVRAGHAGALPRSIRTSGDGSVPTFAGDAQHTAAFGPAAQDLNAIHWSTSIDQNTSGAFAHYGAPLITAANTVLTPVKTASDGFQVSAFDGTDGRAKYTLTTDYILPSHNWIPAYQPVLSPAGAGLRLYYSGAGGTVYFIDDPDSDSPGAPTHLVFYTSLANYLANAAAFNASIFVNTPLTADSNGNVFFGFRVQGTAPAPLNTTQSGFARIDASGNGTYVLAGDAAADANIARDSHNSAPALSNDGTTLYVVVKGASTSNYGYLLGLNATTLATKYKRFLADPRTGSGADILDDGTASPTVAPDDDVYMGIMGNPFNGSRGFLLHFSGDLTVLKTPGGFGWDYTAAIVPREVAPSYTGSSSYLIFAKYNNYAGAGDGGDGVNKIALLDPNDTEVDPHPASSGLLVMREVLTVTGPTPDSENPSLPDAVREWCINTAAVNPATNSVFTPSEDGHIYRWNLATNSLSQVAALTAGIGEPYVPTVIGPDGVVYTLNGGTLFALGGLDGVGVTLSSSLPDVRGVVAGQPVTFTASVANTGSSGDVPTGTVTFEDTVYFVIGQDELGSRTTVLASGVPLDATGHASLTTSALEGDNHFIKASYSGSGQFVPGAISLVQKVHSNASSTTLASLPNPSSPGQSVTFTATVASEPPGSGTPGGMVTFQEGAAVLAQVPLGGSGAASFSTSALSIGSHTVTAVYASDSTFASSSGDVVQVVQGPSTPTMTPSPASTDTPTNTPTPTSTPTKTPTKTPTSTPTRTPTKTPTNTRTQTPTRTPTKTPTNTRTPTPTRTPTRTPTNTSTLTPTGTPTATPTNPAQSPTPTPTPSPVLVPPLTSFRDVRRADDINVGTDLGGTGFPAIDFTGAAPAAGDTWITVYDSTPGDDTVQNIFGSVGLSADVLIHSYNNKKGAGLVALFNEASGKTGLALVIYDSGGSDLLALGTMNKATGQFTALKTVSLGGGIGENAWYRLTMDVIASGANVTVTGKVFKHATPADPNSPVGAQVGVSVAFSAARPAGIDAAGEVGIAGSAYSAAVDSSVTNVTILQ